MFDALKQQLKDMSIYELNEQRINVSRELDESTSITEQEWRKLFNGKPTKKCIGMWDYLALKITLDCIDKEIEYRWSDCHYEDLDSSLEAAARLLESKSNQKQ